MVYSLGIFELKISCKAGSTDTGGVACAARNWLQNKIETVKKNPFVNQVHQLVFYERQIKPINENYLLILAGFGLEV